MHFGTAQLLRRFVARMPERWQITLKRVHYDRQLKKGTFTTPEPECQVLHTFIGTGDWVIDVGANVGHYTKRFSELVGTTGRVIALEPVTITFGLLTYNVQSFSNQNITLFNAAA